MQAQGLKTIPFKAQNVSNNSSVADDGSEIATATFFQASVLKEKTSYHLNPILLKSGNKSSSSLIINGKEIGQKDIKLYYKELDRLKPIVKDAFDYLDRKYDCIVAEGAGGCVELNLLQKDLSNTFIANEFNTKIILVADIEKGGVFASIYGTVKLLKKKFRKNLIGVIINKFRGDMSLFDNGIKIIEEEFKIPVLGVLPYKSLNLGFEDSASLQNYTKKSGKIKVGVIRLPHISNFTDFEPLIIDENLSLEFISTNINDYEFIILPGSKRVVEDLQWLKDIGLFEDILNFKGKIIAICGGYEMLFENIIDKKRVESDKEKVRGFGLIKSDITFEDKKIVKRSSFKINDFEVDGYEIHYGISKQYPLFYENKKIFGTFLHGIFDNDRFREYIFQKDYKSYNFKKKRDKILDDFIQELGKNIDIKYILKKIEKNNL